MKKKIFVMLLTIIPTMVIAQEELPRNEVEISIGANYEDNPFFKKTPKLKTGTPMQAYYNEKYYIDEEISGPTISTSYRHKISKHFYIGGYIGYKMTSANLYSHLNNQKASEYRAHYAITMPCIRFYIHDNNYVRVYTEAAGGLSYFWEKELHKNKYEEHIRGSYHITIVGVNFTIAKKLTLSTDLGAGYLGIVRAGIGYRF